MSLKIASFLLFQSLHMAKAHHCNISFPLLHSAAFVVMYSHILSKVSFTCFLVFKTPWSNKPEGYRYITLEEYMGWCFFKVVANRAKETFANSSSP
ncbi:hypothetical protein Syun_012519 [Stephania yunnanensis]|uniref:Secreted protein n=1 Tax=Stephania yunnanensis TaxID=152371 RepID=A0AAP0K0C3_9MAGN